LILTLNPNLSLPLVVTATTNMIYNPVYNQDGSLKAYLDTYKLDISFIMKPCQEGE